MKKFSFLLPVLAIVLAVGASAFTHKTARPYTNTIWFVYDDMGNPNSASSYSIAPNSGAQPSCPENEAHLCAIQADEDGSSGQPVQSELNSLSSASNGFTTPATGVLYKP